MTTRVSEAATELLPDGKVAVYATWDSCSRGGSMGVLAVAHEALQPLKLSPKDIHFILDDKVKSFDREIQEDGRSQIPISEAIYEGINQLLKAMKKEDGTYRTYDEMVADGIGRFYRGVMNVE